MAQSLARIFVHLIFSTKDRAAVLAQAVRPDLRAYFVGILSNLDCPCLEVGCMADHAHMLFVLHRTLSAANVVEEVKKASSKWLKTRSPAMRNFHWQNGYGAFSVSPSACLIHRYLNAESAEDAEKGRQIVKRKNGSAGG